MFISQATFKLVMLIWIGVAVGILVVLQFKRAAYGRYRGESKVPQIPDNLGWVLMESLSPLLMLALFMLSERRDQLVAQIFIGAWLLHYGHRSWIYPFLSMRRGRQIPISIIGMGMLFNAFNAGSNGYWLFHLGPALESSWLSDPRFVVGALLFVAGMLINVRADYQLVALRQSSNGDYQIPTGGLYRWISCPNYLGEILEWFGWALATWSLAGLAFAIWTFCNLAPRAVTHHRWYRQQFTDYPVERRALVPFVL